MAVIPTGLDLTQIPKPNGKRFRYENGIDFQRPVIGHIGRVAHEKNIAFLLRVLRGLKQEVPDILLLIAGEGPAKRSLQRQANKMGLKDNIMFLGYLSREQDLWDCYHAANVFVFSSRTETQGIVLLEAMAVGMPVVSTAVLGTIDILQSERGALIASESVDDFVTKVNRLLRNSLLRENKSREAKSFVHEWTDTAMAKKMESFYMQTLQQHALEKSIARTLLTENA